MSDEAKNSVRPALARIETSGLTKRFRLQNGPRVMLNMLLSAGGRRGDSIEALRGVSLSVSEGEVVGLIGKNGSGKSTLLKILAGLHASSGGSMRLHGRALYISGFYFASNPYMTVRENISLVGTVFGLRHKEIAARMDDILGFAGLERFVDVETFKLSSGMLARLNASVAFYCMEHSHPRILLLDEVLSVGGDIEFQKRSFDKIQALVRSGAAVLAATHDLDFVEHSCDRAIWLESGQLRMDGSPKDVIGEYKARYS